MAFSLFADVPLSSQPLTKLRIGLLHEHGCSLCPYNHIRGNLHPHMPAHGAKQPRVYMLGEAPGEQEDREGVPFIGPAGQVLRFRIPPRQAKTLRWNNVVRTRPPGNEDPTFVATEACRPSVAGDIAASKPQAIFGFGNVPLHWLIGQAGITKWRGKRVPVVVDGHPCWYFPMVHPSYILRTRTGRVPRNTQEYGSDDEFAFARDIAQAFAALDTLPDPHVHTRDEALAGITCVTGQASDSVQHVIDFIGRCYDAPVVGIDYETTHLRPYYAGADLLSIALSIEGETLAFPVYHSGTKWLPHQRDAVMAAFVDFLFDAPCIKVAHNLPFELEWSAHLFGDTIVRAPGWQDTLSQAYILDPRPGSLSLEFLCIEYFGLAIKDMFKLDVRHLGDEPLATVLPYNGVDAKYCRLLHQELTTRLAERDMGEVYASHLRRIPTMVLTQLQGVPVDQKVTQRFVAEYESRAANAEAAIAALPVMDDFTKRLGRTFRPSANRDVLDLLNTVLGLVVTNADEAVLGAVKHEVAPLLLEWRRNSKILSTYLKPMLPDGALVFPDGKLHPVISTCKTRTQRTSSEFPNEQNFPKRGFGHEIRGQVRPAAGYKIVSFDYSGIQARNVAMESRDRKLVKAFWNRYDIHADWCERIVRAYPRFVAEGAAALATDKKLFAAYRHRAKNQFVFPSFFGAQSKSVGSDLGIGEELARDLQEAFFDEFSGVGRWHAKVRQDYHEYGYVTGLSGFRRYAPVRFNEQINSPIQSDEAAIVCDAMTRLSMLGYQAAMEIHDDLTYIIPTKEVDVTAEVIVREMLACPFKWAKIVPLGVEMSIGPDWYHMEKVGEYFSND